MLKDKEIIQGIASNNNRVLNYIYKELFPYIKSYVLQRGGSLDQAEDLFQEAMIIIVKKINAEQLSLQCKFSTYLYAICKVIWIQDRKKHIRRMNGLNESSMFAEPETSYGRDHMDEAKELFDKHFRKLGPDCQKILTLYFNGLTIEEIREVMGINTVHHASDKKYRCKKMLIDRIKNDPKFRNLRNE